MHRQIILQKQFKLHINTSSTSLVNNLCKIVKTFQVDNSRHDMKSPSEFLNLQWK